MSARIHFLALCAAAAVSLGACSATTASDAAAPAAEQPVSVAAQQPSAPASVDSPTLIDVRTPKEFAEGHLDGAINIDIRSADFADKIRALDPTGDYAVYCRSGKRSAHATQIMLEQNFTNVTNLGSTEEASQALGVPIVP